MNTDTPEPGTEVTPQWAPLPPAAPKPPRDPKRLALVAGAVTLAVILIATAVFALRGQSHPTTAHTTVPTATIAPTPTTIPTATTVPTATPAPGTAPAAPVSVYFAASDNSSGISKVVALNPADGSVRWQNDSLRGVPFTPAVGGNRVFVLMFNGPLVALQALDGKEVWRVAHPPVSIAPVLDGDVLYTAAAGDSSHSGSIVAYSAASGAVLWQKDLGLNAFPHIGASGGALYLNLGRSFEALHGSDGSVLWQHPLDTPITVDPAVVDGTLYFNYYGEVFAFNATDGSPRWHSPPDLQGPQGDTHVSVGNGLVFAGGGTNLLAIHEADGTLAWRKQCRTIPYGTAVSSSAVYAACSTGGVDALQTSDGQSIWSAQLNGGIAWPAVVAGNAVFVSMNPGATPNGAPAYVYALRPGDGSVMWSITATLSGGVSAPVVA